MATKRNFTVVKGDGSECGQYSANEPRRAAMKAITKSRAVGEMGEISIREKGTDKIRTYTFEVVTVKSPENAPAWVPKQAKQAIVKYVSTTHKEA